MSASLPISVTMPVKNAEKYLAQSLSALAGFDEIIVLDNGSTDRTPDIAASFPNVRLYHSPFIGFGPLKNRAAELARHDWILNIDSDEIVTPELMAEIRSLPLDRPHTVFTLPRLNHYRGRPITTCGWSPDPVRRLYHKAAVRFNNRRVHESLELPEQAEIRHLPSPLLHYSFDGAADLIDKMQRYTSLFAEQQQFRKRTSVAAAVGHGLAAFIKSYVFKRGFLSGGDGWVISAANAMGAYYKYVKLNEANQRLGVSLIITTYNRPDALEAVLQSVKAQKRLPDEVLVADDGSGEATAELIRRQQTDFPVPLHHIWQPDDGFRLAESRNRALAAARGDYIVMIDGDMVLHPQFIADHVRAARKGLFVQGSRVVLTEGKTAELLADPSAYRVLKWYEKGLEKRWEKRLSACRLPWLSAAVLKKEKTGWFHGIRGCNMGFFRSDALAVNGFNNDFVGWGREDSEFVARLFNRGGKRANLKFAAVAYHLYHPEAPRAALPENDKLLEQAVAGRLTRCERGVNVFLPPEPATQADSDHT
ncbi:glycosyltransferase family 2 protein [Neisseria shayeganii]|uniref:Two-domain glucosyltransferase n=1 Tax=Neisseria shayeganii 871 TaxID=1032488 RepID=G4CHY2_9NEIS|nr:glycosyltransferase [Neisseria shayeganii]EGY52566.1 two-domain glucosyltransferase [Neisseria shayeganii 871]